MAEGVDPQVLTTEVRRDGASIEVADLRKTFGTRPALDGLGFTVRPGDILGLLGPNGAGKSTTVKILAGLLRPDAGHARVGGVDVLAAPLEARRRLGYVPESAALFETLTAREYLEVVADLHHLDPPEAVARIRDLLEGFGLAGDADRRLSAFSRGMKQKLLIAAALLHRPPVVLLDEPLTGLDATAVRLVKELLRGLAARGHAILICSHLLDIVERLCTRLVVIHHGRCLAEGTVAGIVADTRTATLEDAFHALTGAPPVDRLASDLLAALGRW